MKKSDFSSAEMFQHKLQIFDRINEGESNQSEIARKLGILTSDSIGNHKNWYVWDHIQDLISSGYVVQNGRKLESTDIGFRWFCKNAIGPCGDEE
jgi:predicted transcriptional regulator